MLAAGSDGTEGSGQVEERVWVRHGGQLFYKWLCVASTVLNFERFSKAASSESGEIRRSEGSGQKKFRLRLWGNPNTKTHTDIRAMPPSRGRGGRRTGRQAPRSKRDAFKSARIEDELEECVISE